MKTALLILLGLSALAAFQGDLQEMPSPELPRHFHKYRRPLARAGDCSLPFPPRKNSAHPVNRTFKVGPLTVRMLPKERLGVEGADFKDRPWKLEVSNRPAGCELWRGDLDRSGTDDLLIITRDLTDVTVTILMIDRRGRPVPWRESGYFEPAGTGLGNLVDLNRDGRAELLQVSLSNYKLENSAVRITLYRAVEAHWLREDGRFAGEVFPIVKPKRVSVTEYTDLSNVVSLSAGKARVTIASLVPGRKENCGVQVPLTFESDGQIRMDDEAAQARRESCHDKLVLSDGRKVNLPEIVVLDGSGTREIAFPDSGDALRLAAEAKKRGLAVQMVGHSCDYGCRPFLLWASE